jgi:membrane associated rhomboid family serine protease
MKDISPLRRTIGAVLFVIGFAWLALGVGLVQGSVISNNWWAALFGLVCIAATGFVLGPAVLKRPFPTTPPEAKPKDDVTPE